MGTALDGTPEVFRSLNLAASLPDSEETDRATPTFSATGDPFESANQLVLRRK